MKVKENKIYITRLKYLQMNTDKFIYPTRAQWMKRNVLKYQ